MKKKFLFISLITLFLSTSAFADFALGAGIAKEFDKRFNCRKRLFDLDVGGVDNWDVGEHGICIAIRAIEPPTIFNLVTKRNYWDKPTLETIKNSLKEMKIFCKILDITKIAMPRIGCGLDKQNWHDVKALIEEVFGDTDIEIVVCSL